MHERRSVERSQNPVETLGFYTSWFCALLSVCLLVLVMRELTAQTRHPLFTVTSLAEALIASLVMLYFAFQRSIVHQLTSLFVSVWYTVRVFALYLAPEHMEYSIYQYGKQVYGHDSIELATRYLMFFCLALLLASVLHAALSPNRGTTNGLEATPAGDKINFFGIRVELRLFLTYALYFCIITALFRITALASEWGIRVGAIYQPEQYLLRIAESLSFPFYLLAIFSFCVSKDRLTRRLSTIIIALIVVDGLVASSRGWLFGLMAEYLICALVLGRAIAKRAQVAALCSVPLTIMLLYPAMSVLRPMMLAGNFNASTYIENVRHNALDGINVISYGDLVLVSLDRFAGFDWLALWVNADAKDIPPNLSMWGEVVDLINKFVPGEIITIPGSMQLNKLQAVLGGTRTYATIDEQGGQGEVAGGVATLDIFFGWAGGLIAAVVWMLMLLWVQRSSIHALHKAYLYLVYLQNFVIGGGYILMPTSFLWYLLVSGLIAGAIRFSRSRSVGYSRGATSGALVPRASAGRLGQTW